MTAKTKTENEMKVQGLKWNFSKHKNQNEKTPIIQGPKVYFGFKFSVHNKN